MGGCSQATIMEASLVHLAGIHTLSAAGCPQLRAAAYMRTSQAPWCSAGRLGCVDMRRLMRAARARCTLGSVSASGGGASSPSLAG